MENRRFTSTTANPLAHSHLESYEMDESPSENNSFSNFSSTSFSGSSGLTSDSYVSKDLLKSATLENLMAQNEEIMARQRVNMRRLATLEDLNQELQNENFQAKNQILNYSDQVQVLKEKDQAWKNKVDELEIEKDKLVKIAKEYENIQAEIERHRKYHDKIKYQVKPYIQSLKVSRDQAQTELENLRNLIHVKDSQVKEMRNQMQEVLRQSKNQVGEMQKQRDELVEHFESQIQRLQEEKSSFQTSYEEIRSKMTYQNQALEKKAELENRVIELDRSKMEMKTQLEREVLRLQARVNEIENFKTRYEIENADLKNHVQEEHVVRLKQEEELIQLRRQMESLRFMWNQKNDENERQRKSLEALEQLNYSLSQKIEELRLSEAQMSRASNQSLIDSAVEQSLSFPQANTPT